MRRWGGSRPEAIGAPYAPPDESASATPESNESALRRAAEAAALRATVWETQAEPLVQAAHLFAGTLQGGGRILTFGAGAASAAARNLARDLLEPPVPSWRSFRADFLAHGVNRPARGRGSVDLGAGATDAVPGAARSFGSADDAAVGFFVGRPAGWMRELFRIAVELGAATVAFTDASGVSECADMRLDVVIAPPALEVPRIYDAHATAYHTVLVLMQEVIQGAGGMDAGPSRLR